MPMCQEAPRKEACSFSLDDISTLLDQMSDKEKIYSLRARSSIRMVHGKQETVYLLFLRNGNESVFERLDNWWNAEAQRALARQLICAALAEQSDPAPEKAPENMAMRTLVQEKALLRVRKMDRMGPQEIQAIFSECIVARQEIQIFQHKLLSISSEDRQKFQKFHQDFNDFLKRGEIMPTLSLFLHKNARAKNPINEILAEAESHYLDAMLQAFMRFTEAVAEYHPIRSIDLALVLALADKRKTVRDDSGQVDTTGLEIQDGEHAAACWTAIDALIGICDKLRCAPSPQTRTQTQALSGGGHTALVPAPLRPPARRSFPQPPSSSLPALQASLFQSLWACSAGRSAGAVYMASTVLMPAAEKMASRARPACAPAATTATTATPMEAVRTSAVAPKPIRPALSPHDIVCDCQGELDFADIDSEALILVADEGGLFSVSAACHQWLAGLGRSQHAKQAHFAQVQDRSRTVLLARAERAPLHAHLSNASVRKLGEIYQAAVAAAARQRRPICLTDLFDYDPRTADQCVEAMLAPIRHCYQQGVQPAIHIRVSSARLKERIVAALKVLLAPPPAERPAVEVIDCLTEADRQLPGLIMVSGDSADPLNRDLARRHAQQARPALPGAAAALRVGPRKSLGSNTRTHLYFYAQPCPLKNGLPDGARIAGEYTALFQAARQHKCRLVTLEILSEAPGHEGVLIAALSAAIMSARAVTPELKVRIVTRNKKIRDGMQGCF